MRRKVLAGLVLAVCQLGMSRGSADPGGGASPVGGPCAEGRPTRWCQPAVEVKKVDKRVYNVACHDFCYPPLCPGKPPCDGCAEPCLWCGHLRTRRALVVKLRKEEKV